jgi:ParB family chromosome partitioning protein
VRDRGSILWLDPRELIEDPENVRHDTPDLEGLAESIKQYGVLQPLGVSRSADRYHVIYGTRRRRASVMAEIDAVPCVELTGDRLVCQLLENLQRAELNDMEKAEGFARLKERLALGNRELSESKLDELTWRTLGVSASTVRRYLRLRELPTGLRALLRGGELSVTQAQHLFAVEDAGRQEEMGRAAADRGLSAATISRACGLLAARPNLPVPEAIAAAERGESASYQAPLVEEQPAKVGPRPKVEEGIDEDRELWGDEAVADEPNDEPVTADGNRVFKISSVDSFCDEVGRLARCLSEGDLARALQKDPKGKIKLDLARRQIQYVFTALDDLLR